MIRTKKGIKTLCTWAAFVLLCLLIFLTLKRLHIEAVGYMPNRPPEQLNRNFHRYIVTYGTNNWKPAPVKHVVVWTPYFSEWGWEVLAQNSMKTCPVVCTYTRDRTNVSTADAVLFNANDLWKYRTLVSTLYEFDIPMPTNRTPNQVWIFLSIEPMNTMRVTMKPFLFNWTVSHRRESTIYYPFTNWFKKSPEEVKEDTRIESTPQDNFFLNKRKFAATMISNCDDDARRYKIIRELKRYVSVDEFGECSGKVICPYRQSPKECRDLYEYKFYLAFDNSYCRDYVSEKYWLAFDRGQIPIIAAPKYNLEMLPVNSYLNVFDFSSIKGLADRMIEIGNNETLYNSFFHWKRYYKKEISIYCKICQELHANRTAQSYSDMEGWIYDDICTKQTVK